MDETTPITSSGSNKDLTDSSSQAIYYGEGQSPSQKRWQIGFMFLVVVSVLLCFVLCIYQGIVKKVSHIAFLYFMFAATLTGVASIHIIMVIFMKTGAIAEGKLWFTYLSALLLIVQTILIDILVFNDGS